jgi:electron transfer flavoprotein alpha subunit
MDTLLCLLHTESDGTLPRGAHEAVGAARDLSARLGGAPFDIGLVGGELAAAAAAVAAAGSRRLLAASDPAFAVPRYATDAAAAEALCRASGAAIVLAPHTSRWARALAAVAHRLGGRADTHLTGISVEDGSVHASRWYYRQRITATLTRAQRPWLMLVEPGAFEPWEGAPGVARTEAIAVTIPETRTRHAGVRVPASTEQTIRPDAALLFVAGAGWTKPQADGRAHVAEAETLILSFLERTQASLGGTKSLVEMSGEGHEVLRFMTYLNQVGQTGSTPRHPKGLATCCHGEEPHTVGWRFVTERRAVNKDASCGWARGKADVLYVADAFEVMARVNALLAK